METNFQKKIYNLFPSFSRSERMVASYFADHYQKIPHMSLKEICTSIGVSEPTVFRFCNDMGFAGIKDLKLYIASHCTLGEDAAAEPSSHETYENADDEMIHEYIARILTAEERILSITISHIDIVNIRKIADILLSHSCIYLYGLGSSNLVCQDAARKLQRMQINAFTPYDEEDVLSLLRNENRNHLLFCISYSGKTQQIINVMKQARELHIPTLLMTSYPQSTAAHYADNILQTYAMEDIFFRVGVTSRVGQFAVLDSVITMIAQLREKGLFNQMVADSSTILMGNDEALPPLK